MEEDPPLVVTSGPAAVLAGAGLGHMIEVLTVTEEEEERLHVPDLICQGMSHLNLHQAQTENFHLEMEPASGTNSS